MRFLAALLVVFLVGCDDPVEPREEEQAPYEVTTLREAVDSATFVDLNENGQALWHEGEQAVLWDNGEILEVPVGELLGPSGEILGDSSVWIDGQLTDLSGLTRGITEEGTVYFSRDDTMFTWKDGVAEVTNLPAGLAVGPEGRVFRYITADDVQGCQVYENGQWQTLPGPASFCFFVMAEENGWILLIGGGHLDSDGWMVNPSGNVIDKIALPPWVHINAHGEAIDEAGEVFFSSDSVLHLFDVFEPREVSGGAINDDGEILAQLDNEVVLLTPR